MRGLTNQMVPVQRADAELFLTVSDCRPLLTSSVSHEFSGLPSLTAPFRNTSSSHYVQPFISGARTSERVREAQLFRLTHQLRYVRPSSVCVVCSLNCCLSVTGSDVM